MKEYFVKTKITTSEHRITIEICPTSSMFDELLQIESISVAMLLWGTGVSIAALVLVVEGLQVNDWRLIGVVGGCSEVIGILIELFPLLYVLVKKKTIRFSEQFLLLKTTLWGIGRTKRYLLPHIADVQHAHPKSRRAGKVCFQYDTRQISFGTRLSPADPHMFVNYMTLMLTFQCHRIERIYFGTRPVTDSIENGTVLYNPDVSPLSIPFVRLKELAIDVATYDFRLIEKFLTYGVNYLEQDYLRNNVVVHVYGDILHLQTNIRNALTNLCHRIQVNETTFNT